MKSGLDLKSTESKSQEKNLVLGTIAPHRNNRLERRKNGEGGEFFYCLWLVSCGWQKKSKVSYTSASVNIIDQF